MCLLIIDMISFMLLDINECANNPCISMAGGRAICKDFVGYYTCECPAGYSGYNCLFCKIIFPIVA